MAAGGLISTVFHVPAGSAPQFAFRSATTADGNTTGWEVAWYRGANYPGFDAGGDGSSAAPCLTPTATTGVARSAVGRQKAACGDECDCLCWRRAKRKGKPVRHSQGAVYL